MSENIEAVQDQINQHREADNQILSFLLGDEQYGVDILRVQEIKGWERTTEIPNSPDYVMGVINLRGAVVPVIDLRVRFGLDKITYDESTVVIILRAADEQTGIQKIIGIVVDGVSDVHTIDLNALQVSPEISGSIHTEYVRGLATFADKMVIVLHIDQLVSNGILKEIKKCLATDE